MRFAHLLCAEKRSRSGQKETEEGGKNNTLTKMQKHVRKNVAYTAGGCCAASLRLLLVQRCSRQCSIILLFHFIPLLSSPECRDVSARVCQHARDRAIGCARTPKPAESASAIIHMYISIYIVVIYRHSEHISQLSGTSDRCFCSCTRQIQTYLRNSALCPQCLIHLCVYCIQRIVRKNNLLVRKFRVSINY